jgi:aromatic-L-amino-acid decarboxylase
MRGHVRSGINHRKRLESWVLREPRVEIAAAPSLSLLCFRLAEKDDGAQVKFLAKLDKEGRCFLIKTKVGGKVILRIACGGVEQDAEDIDALIQVLTDALDTFAE